MNKRCAIWIITGALAFGTSACLWESDDDGAGGTIGGGSASVPGFTGGGGFTGGSSSGSTGGSSPGFIGGTSSSGSIGGVFLLQRAPDGGTAESDELEGSSDDRSGAAD